MNTKLEINGKPAKMIMGDGKNIAKKNIKFRFEYTDTFGSDANYCWVKRNEVELPENISDLALMRRAKNWGDTLAFYPRGHNTVLFVSADF
jgi:hypothetical protein